MKKLLVPVLVIFMAVPVFTDQDFFDLVQTGHQATEAYLKLYNSPY